MTDKKYTPRDFALQPPAFHSEYKSTRLRSPRQPLVRIDQTPSERTGPVFSRDDISPGDFDLLNNFAKSGSPIGERILLHGRVIDAYGRAVPNALVEIWQANAGGRYRHLNDTYLAPLDPNFGGCGRTLTGEDGSYRFMTVKPGAYPWPNDDNSWRPAHVHFSIFGDAFVQRLITQCYFEGDPLIPLCPIVRTIPDRHAIDRLVARLDMENNGSFDFIAYRFDIVLRGRGATIFENRMEGT